MDYAKAWLAITAGKLIGRWRLFLGFCPECNSDAPGLYTCPVCHYYSGHYPPSRFRRARWWVRYLNRLYCPPGYVRFMDEVGPAVISGLGRAISESTDACDTSKD